MNFSRSCALRECTDPGAIAIQEAEDEIVAGVWCTGHRVGAERVLMRSPASAASSPGSRALRGAGPGPLCRAGAGPATRRVPPLSSGHALGPRPPQPVWAMGPGTLHAEPLPVANVIG